MQRASHLAVLSSDTTFFFNANTVLLVNPVETGFFQTNFCHANSPLKNFLLRCISSIYHRRRGLFYSTLNNNKIELIIYAYVLLNTILFLYFYLYIDRIIQVGIFSFSVLNLYLKFLN